MYADKNKRTFRKKKWHFSLKDVYWRVSGNGYNSGKFTLSVILWGSLNYQLCILPVCTHHVYEQQAFVQSQYMGHNNSQPPTAQNPIICHWHLHWTGQRFRNSVLQNKIRSGKENWKFISFSEWKLGKKWRQKYPLKTLHFCWFCDETVVIIFVWLN